MTTLHGTGVTPLTGVGTARWYERTVDLPPASAPETVDAKAEFDAFEQARDQAREELETERDRTSERIGEEEAAVFDAHVQFLTDPQIADEVEAAVSDVPAAHAVKRVFDAHVAEFENLDGRMAERADDLRDVRDRLLRLLTDGARTDLGGLPAGTVVLAERLTPSDTAQLDPDRVAGFVTATGGRTSHAAIFARSLTIPAIVGVGDSLSTVEDGTTVLVDGETGDVVEDPDPDRREAAANDETTIRFDPVATVDGHRIEVAANVGSTRELDPAVERGADGVGLFRTEFLFLDREEAPAEDEQYDAVTTALSAFPDARVVVRTLDVGGDKPIPYLDLPEETNPFLGARGIRLSLTDHAALFETQLRALLRAAASDHGDGLAVMFPLVATVEELEAALDRIETVADDLAAEGIDHGIPEIGVMVETPAAVFCAADLAARVDFLSIGTNDLTQYVMAASREAGTVADLHDPLHPAVLRAIDHTIEAGHDNDAWVGMCGEMAGDPDLTRLLVGLELDELSMSAVTVPAVKAAVEAVDISEARGVAERVVAAATRDEVRALL